MRIQAKLIILHVRSHGRITDGIPDDLVGINFEGDLFGDGDGDYAGLWSWAGLEFQPGRDLRVRRGFPCSSRSSFTAYFSLKVITEFCFLTEKEGMSIVSCC